MSLADLKRKAAAKKRKKIDIDDFIEDAASYAKGKDTTSPSEIVKITYNGTGDYHIEPIYLEDGTSMSGATVAAPFGDYILTGNVMDKHFLVLKRNK